MNLNDLIRQLKKAAYRHGGVMCVAPMSHGNDYAPLEFEHLPAEQRGTITIPPRLVFGPHGTKAALAKKAREIAKAKELAAKEAQEDEEENALSESENLS